MKRIDITVGKKSMTFFRNNAVYSLPRLSDTNKLGKHCFWEISVKDNKIYRNSYQEEGKVREFPPTECVGKNIGRANETTPNQQALFEAYTMWTKKQDQGYRIDTGVDDTDVDDPSTVVKQQSGNQQNKITDQSTDESNDDRPAYLPMLANKYTQRSKHLAVPFGISRKLDGIRVLASQNKRKELILTSRLGKPFSFLDNIRTSLRLFLQGHPNLLIDGELYSHDLPFNTISGVVRAKKTKSPYDAQIELWIFDLIDMKNDRTQAMRYEDRMMLLKSLEDTYNERGGQPNLRFVYYDLCNSHEDIEDWHAQYVEEGFEGVMCRNLSGPYLFKNRSNDLLKHKAFEDAEFTIVGAKPGVGTEKGAIVFECQCNDADTDIGTFDVRPRGSIEKRRQMYLNKNQYIGKQLTVRYQPHTNQADQEAATGVPRFPVGIDVRDYE